MTVSPFRRPPTKVRGPITSDTAGASPVVGMPVTVMFRNLEGAFAGTIVGFLASHRGRRVALVRLAVENGPRQDDFRAPWFAERPGVDEWAEVARFPASMHQACFPVAAVAPIDEPPARALEKPPYR